MRRAQLAGPAVRPTTSRPNPLGRREIPPPFQPRPEQKKGRNVGAKKPVDDWQLAVFVERVGVRAGQTVVLALGALLVTKSAVGHNAALNQAQAPEERNPQWPGNFGVEHAAGMVRGLESLNNPQYRIHEQKRKQVRLKFSTGFGLLPQVGVALQGFHELGDEVDWN